MSGELRSVASKGAFVGSPTVLVVEDDEAVQALVADMLNEGGVEPATARTGEEAFTLLKGRQTRYSALITDINLLGRFNGWEVARAAREVDPNFPVVYMTGAGADEWAILGVPNSVLLRKPFAPAQIVTAVSQLLNVGSTQPPGS
ncbi:response regulator [Bradyrhizobium sp. F1.13.3]|uniref:response regulator n=1 Tax=Bradyrhizobium sp. F1.13.3 TaxID=3156351 RepID=UPI003396787D